MQTQIAFFPEGTKLINATLGVQQHDGFCYYLHNGNPIFCHKDNDKNSYRFIMGNLIFNHLCTITELTEALGEHRKNIERYAKTYREKGADYFFRRKETRGGGIYFSKMTNEFCVEVQRRLDEGQSNYRIGKELGVSEGTISNHIKSGRLKKKQ